MFVIAELMRHHPPEGEMQNHPPEETPTRPKTTINIKDNDVFSQIYEEKDYVPVMPLKLKRYENIASTHAYQRARITPYQKNLNRNHRTENGSLVQDSPIYGFHSFWIEHFIPRETLEHIHIDIEKYKDAWWEIVFDDDGKTHTIGGRESTEGDRGTSVHGYLDLICDGVKHRQDDFFHKRSGRHYRDCICVACKMNDTLRSQEFIRALRKTLKEAHRVIAEGDHSDSSPEDGDNLKKRVGRVKIVSVEFHRYDHGHFKNISLPHEGEQQVVSSKGGRVGGRGDEFFFVLPLKVGRYCSEALRIGTMRSKELALEENTLLIASFGCPYIDNQGVIRDRDITYRIRNYYVEPNTHSSDSDSPRFAARSLPASRIASPSGSPGEDFEIDEERNRPRSEPIFLCYGTFRLI